MLLALHWTLSNMSMSLILKRSELDSVLQCWVEGKDYLPQPAGSTPPNAAQDIWLVFATITVVGSLMVDVVSSRTPRSFSTFHPVSPQQVLVLGLFYSRCKTLHFPLLNFMMSLLAHFPSQAPSGVSATPISFIWSANLLRVCSAPPSWSYWTELYTALPLGYNASCWPPRCLCSTHLHPLPTSTGSL